MKQKINIFLLVTFFALPTKINAQYFQRLYDIDSSNDWGLNILVENDSNYIVFGTMINSTIYKWGLFNMKIATDGNNVISKKIIQFHNLSLYIGYPSSVISIFNNNYLSPVTAQLYYGIGIDRSWAGLLKYNIYGDTVFLKTYTDTPIFYDRMTTCSIMPNRDYVAGGERALSVSTNMPKGYIIRTDSNGNMIWINSYQLDTTQDVIINNIVPLPDGRMAVGAYSRYDPGGWLDYYLYYPWFMLLDSMGNIIRDTLYTAGYQAGGMLYKDSNGGYFTIGRLDYIYAGNPDALQSFPAFIAHLDTNFRTTWQTVFAYDTINNHREPYYAKQLTDGSYVVVGDKWNNNNPNYEGWAAKVSPTGSLIWNHIYTAGDTVNSSYIRGVAEKPDGGLVMVGCSHNDTLPTWHTIQDMWLIGVDSNGCENFSCLFPTASKEVSEPKNEVFSIFPNPTSGNITISAIQGGVFALYSMDGRGVFECAVGKGNTEVRLPAYLSKGVYMGKFVGEDGWVGVVRVVCLN